MCGIIGAYRQDIKEGLEALKHRGPDFRFQFQLGSFNFGHARLSILDPEVRSNQPFLFRNSILVYNGELWNYKELRTELQNIGYEFTTTGDTEVVSIALHHWGIDALERFNGMFALGWTNGDECYLARDRFGEVPLYFIRQPFFFASERKALLKYGINNAELFPAGHYFEYDAVNPILENVALPYYSVSNNPIQYSKVDDVYSKLEKLLLDAVEERTIADVPICTLLSGGIDSSLITAILSKSYKDLVAYTAVFNEKSSDLKFARMLAKELNVKLVEVKINSPTLEDIEDTIWCIESPLKTQVEIAYPCIKLAQAIKSDGFKVTFSGDGSDEMFGSYRFAYYGIKEHGYKNYVRKLYSSLSYKNYIRNNKAFMAHGVEVRLPFANRQLVEYCLNWPEEFYNSKNEKMILKSSMKNILPDYITKRHKIGFQDGLGIKSAFKTIINPSGYKSIYKGLFNEA